MIYCFSVQFLKADFAYSSFFSQGCIFSSCLPICDSIYQFYLHSRFNPNTNPFLKLTLGPLTGSNISHRTIISFSFSTYHFLLSVKAIFLMFYSIPLIPLKAASGPYSSFYSSQHPTVDFNYFVSEKFKCSLILITSYNFS